MATELFHLSARSVGSRAVFSSTEIRLRAVRRFLTYADGRALWFAVADTHLHSVMEIASEARGLVARDVRMMLESLADARFEVPHLRPIESRTHLERTFPYILANREHHGLPGDPLADPGSAAPDLVGARILAGFDPTRWRRHLPRLESRELFDRIELPIPKPATNDHVRAAGAHALVQAAAAMVGVPALTGKTRDVVAARIAVVKLATQAGIDPAEQTWALGVRRQGISERRQLAAPELEQVLRVRLSFGAALAGRAKAAG